MTKKQKSKKPANSGTTQEERNEKGQFKPGFSGNPDGPKPGYKQLSTQLKEALAKIWEGSASEVQELLIKRLLTLAVVKGDMRAIELIFERIDGKVKDHFIGELSGFIGHGQIPEEDMGDLVSEFVANFKTKLHEKNAELGD